MSVVRLPDRGPAAVAVRELVAEAVGLFDGAARARGVTVTASAARRLLPLGHDADAIQRAIGYLLASAIERARPGGRVAVVATATADGVTITVRGAGAGPALLIARLLVESEGGTFGVRTAGGRITSAWLTLPGRPVGGR